LWLLSHRACNIFLNSNSITFPFVRFVCVVPYSSALENGILQEYIVLKVRATKKVNRPKKTLHKGNANLRHPKKL